MNLFGRHVRGPQTEPAPDPVYVSEYWQLYSDAAQTATQNPVAFAAELEVAGVPRDEAISAVRDLLQEHLNQAGSLAVASTVER